MPDFIPGPLKKEVDIGGRKIALWAPVAGGALAVVVFAIARLRGGAGSATSATQTTPTGVAATQAAAAETNALTSALAQIEKAQLGINEQVAAVQEGFAGAQSKVEAFGAQISGFQAQLGEQAQALQAGIAGVETAQAAFKSDVEARVQKVEQGLSNLEKSVQEGRTDFSPQQKFKLASTFDMISTRMINPALAQLGLPTWQFRVNAQSGQVQAKPSTAEGYWQPIW